MALRVPFRPMLATLTAEPFDRAGWVFEQKYDGIRLLVARRKGRVRLYSRNLIERTGQLPAVERSLEKLAGGDLVLDGELVTFDPRGVSRFELLEGARSVLVLFDALEVNGRSLLAAPLSERRAALEALTRKRDPHLMLSERLPGGGLLAYEKARAAGWEGIVAKDESSTYAPATRSRAWLKVKVVKESAFVIGGFTPPTGKRAHLGALLIGLFDDAGLRFTGKVGSGFGAASLADLARRLEPRPASPFRDAPRFKKVTWVEPDLVAQVRFMEWTEDGKLRHPVFLGLRDDKAARECTWAARQP